MNTELIILGFLILISIIILFIMVKPIKVMSNRKKTYSTYFRIEFLLRTLCVGLTLFIINRYSEITIQNDKGLIGIIIIALLICTTNRRAHND